MFFPYLLSLEHGDEFRGTRGLFHIRSSLCFFALHQAHNADDLESEIAGGFDRLDRGRTGGARVIHDHHMRSLLAEALDALARAVLLFSLSHQKSVKLAADDRNRRDDWISAHGESADGLRVPAMSANLVPKNLAGKARSFGVQRGGAAIHVVVARAAGRQFEFAQAKGFC